MSESGRSDSPQQERLNQVIAEYLESEKSGQTADRQKLLNQNPDRAEELKAFFADHDKMHALAVPVRVSTGPRG